MNRIEYSTRLLVDIHRDQIGAQVEEFLARGGEIEVVPQGFAGIRHLPPRRADIDPETRLVRKQRVIRPMHLGRSADKEAQKELDREKLRALARSI